MRSIGHGAHPPPAGRLEWVDIAKGIAIVLVVVGHVLGGLMSSHAVSPEPFWNRLYQWIYLFHMPVFFFISGWLIEFRSARKGPPAIRHLIATLFYPYFLWGLITWALHMIADVAGISNNPVDPWIPFRLLYDVQSGPWFLLVLFLFHIFYWVLAPTPHRHWWMLAAGLVAFSDFACFRYSKYGTTQYFLELNLVFYAIGILAAKKVPALHSRFSRATYPVGGIVLLAWLAWIQWIRPDLPPYSKLPLGIIGIAGVLGLSIGLAAEPWTKPICWLGQQSLVIYLLHSFAPPVTRWLLTRYWEVTSGPWLLAIGVASGLLSSSLAAWIVARSRLRLLFRFPESDAKPFAS